MQNRSLQLPKIIGIIILLGFTAFYLVQVSHFLPLFDFIEYWSAGYLNRSGGNPYGLSDLYSIQSNLGWTSPKPLLAWNPPWSLGLMMSLSLLPYPYGRILWLLASILIVLFCSEKTWTIYGGKPKNRTWAPWVGISFSPVFFNLLMGQITPLILLGVVGFLGIVKENPKHWQDGLLAGLSISAIAIKPQLLYLVPIALFLWSIKNRSWSIFFGFAGTILISSLITIMFNSQAFDQYFHALAEYPPNYWATPTIGYYLRTWVGLKQFWLQFIPILLGLAWLGHYWMKRKDTWNWRTNLPIILVVSSLTSSYSWIHDLIVLVPIVILIFIWLQNRPWSPLSITMVLVYILANLSYLVLHFKFDDSVFIWFTFVVFILFLPVHLWLIHKPTD
jgi:hypothetical protein